MGSRRKFWVLLASTPDKPSSSAWRWRLRQTRKKATEHMPKIRLVNQFVFVRRYREELAALITLRFRLKKGPVKMSASCLELSERFASSNRGSLQSMVQEKGQKTAQGLDWTRADDTTVSLSGLNECCQTRYAGACQSDGVLDQELCFTVPSADNRASKTRYIGVGGKILG